MIKKPDSSAKSALSAELLHKALLGEGDVIRVAAERMIRAGFAGNHRES